MSIVRAVWWALAIAAVAFTAGTAISPVGDVSLSCAKTGSMPDDHGTTSCTDSIVRALGVWPLVGLAAVLTIPPVVAAVSRRMWVSWAAVAILAVASAVGLTTWASFWGSLVIAAPMATLGAIAVAAHRARTRRSRADAPG
ncbi:ABC transporter permease [Rhodococcus rhodnii]|uniref:Uncharacterized protein n=2 Tax=Rhodococcus rhodnii TaxID=38312 RepID=R7WJU4_9NOCA|nr:hypothetical protein [Rhodococcus rhodnii]EOM75591.1 hypothetical protein Rrhod_3051 [Rhodococcus rhodnii LMG 5362]TXG91885.1 ABC transporter permease [Rhodococcus rhodnii]